MVVDNEVQVRKGAKVAVEGEKPFPLGFIVRSQALDRLWIAVVVALLDFQKHAKEAHAGGVDERLGWKRLEERLGQAVEERDVSVFLFVADFEALQHGIAERCIVRRAFHRLLNEVPEERRVVGLPRECEQQIGKTRRRCGVHIPQEREQGRGEGEVAGPGSNLDVLCELLLVGPGDAGLADEVGVGNVFEILGLPFDPSDVPAGESLVILEKLQRLLEYTEENGFVVSIAKGCNVLQKDVDRCVVLWAWQKPSEKQEDGVLDKFEIGRTGVLVELDREDEGENAVCRKHFGCDFSRFGVVVNVGLDDGQDLSLPALSEDGDAADDANPFAGGVLRRRPGFVDVDRESVRCRGGGRRRQPVGLNGRGRFRRGTRLCRLWVGLGQDRLVCRNPRCLERTVHPRARAPQFVEACGKSPDLSDLNGLSPCVGGVDVDVPFKIGMMKESISLVTSNASGRKDFPFEILFFRFPCRLVQER